MKKEELEIELARQGKLLVSTNECLCDNSTYFYFDWSFQIRRCASCTGFLSKIVREVKLLTPKPLYQV